VASVQLARPRRGVLSHRIPVPAFLIALAALSAAIRTRQLNAGLWIDEGLSIGIAHHHWSSIPGLLNQDGSPPGYYLLLGLWIRVFGDGERAAHSLSLVFGLACIPLAYAAATAIFDRRTGLICATLAAFDPFLTYYAQETRMYEVEAFLSFLVAYAYVQGVLRGRTAWTVALVPAIAAMVYVHNWALFFCVGLAAGTALGARRRLKRFALVAGGVAVLYLPWLPTVWSQVQHTGAPWSTAPGFRDLVLSPGAVVNGDAVLVALVLVGGAGLLALAGRRDDDEHTIVSVLLTVVVVTVLLAWLASQLSPAWTTRYFAVVLGPILLVGARGLARAGTRGIVALAVILFLWAGYSVRDDKENARQLAAGLSGLMRPGELVVSTHPEQVPVLRYYLGGGYRWSTTMGPVPDPQIFDWRDAVHRLRTSDMQGRVDQTLAAVRPGGEFVVVSPVFRDYHAWNATWTRLVWKKSLAYSSALQQDPRVRLVGHVTTDEIRVRHNYFKLLQAFVYRRVG
jgi:mannosyltransferase